MKAYAVKMSLGRNIKKTKKIDRYYQTTGIIKVYYFSV